MKKNSKLLIIFAIPLLFSNCASILNGKYQNVNVHTNSSDSKVYVNNELKGEGNVVSTKLRRDANVKQIKVEREGFKDQNFITYQTKKSPLYIMSWVPFGILIYPPLYDYGEKAYDYDKELYIDRADEKILSRTDEEKYVYIQNTAFNLEEESFEVKSIKSKNYEKGKNKFKGKESNKEKIEVDNTLFTNTLNDLLLKYNYADTTGTILKKKTNTMFVNASVENVEFYNIYDKVSVRYQSYITSTVKINWELTDIYGQTKVKKTNEAKSGEFGYFSKNQKEIIFNCLNDAITYSFLDFMQSPEVRKYLNKEEDQPIEYDMITLKRGKSPSSLDQAMKASVTIKTKDGHGSGFAVSKDGYILTNLHVVANNDEVEIFTNENETYKAQIVRQNEYKDLALLKVEKTFPYSFNIIGKKNYNIGDDIFAIGTPKSIELGQTLSKGIISGERSNEGENYIQTDASVNAGNSGGPLVNRNGELLGVVNSKLTGVGIEGIGFAIPTFEIQKALYIN